jgi:hypothetical protein
MTVVITCLLAGYLLFPSREYITYERARQNGSIFEGEPVNCSPLYAINCIRKDDVNRWSVWPAVSMRHEALSLIAHLPPFITN